MKIIAYSAFKGCNSGRCDGRHSIILLLSLNVCGAICS